MLNTVNERKIMDNLKEFFKERTVIIVAHRLSTVVNADKILYLQDGRIEEEGSHETLSAKRGSYYNLIKNQLELNKIIIVIGATFFGRVRLKDVDSN